MPKAAQPTRAPKTAAVKDPPLFWQDLELLYRTLCVTLFNFVPTSGHPGGSLSSGPAALSLVFDAMDYDFTDPDAAGADLMVYAAGHKALGLYAMHALRHELARAAGLTPKGHGHIRLEDLLGFRRNPTQPTPLFKKFKARALDGHPTPANAFVPIASGASGVGFAAGVGLALAAADEYGDAAPRVHMVEGEGGLTPGRVQEAMSTAATAGLQNMIVHLDWNQASIDSDRVTAEGNKPGDYVQWEPKDLFAVHGWNVIWAGDGHDFAKVHKAQKQALELKNGRPTAVIYRTIKGQGYGIEGKASHGAGHAYCSEGYYKAQARFEERFKVQLPRREAKDPAAVEQLFWDTLLVVREVIERNPAVAQEAARRLEASRKRLAGLERRPRQGAPDIDSLVGETKEHGPALSPDCVPDKLQLPAGKAATTRAALGDAMAYLNARSRGALLGCAADLLGSTSVNGLNAGFPGGFLHLQKNPGSRLLSVGGICEDAMGAVMAGVSSYGRHVGVTSSYSAFIAPLEHVAARLHVVGQQGRCEHGGKPRTWIMVCAHAGPMTGEDGPTHADVQALQLLSGNFPKGTVITLTPWEAQEVWPLLIAGLQAHPSVLVPFVTRPAIAVPDRAALGLPPASQAAKGVYAMRRADTKRTLILQGSSVTTVFMRDVLPRLEKEGIKLNVFYVASAELFDLLPEKEQHAILPPELLQHSMAITDFTLATAYRWVRSEEGVKATLYPFRNGLYLGSGNWESLLLEGELHGPSQFEAVADWAKRKS